MLNLPVFPLKNSLFYIFLEHFDSLISKNRAVLRVKFFKLCFSCNPLIMLLLQLMNTFSTIHDVKVGKLQKLILLIFQFILSPISYLLSPISYLLSPNPLSKDLDLNTLKYYRLHLLLSVLSGIVDDTYCYGFNLFVSYKAHLHLRNFIQ